MSISGGKKDIVDEIRTLRKNKADNEKVFAKFDACLSQVSFPNDVFRAVSLLASEGEEECLLVLFASESRSLSFVKKAILQLQQKTSIKDAADAMQGLSACLDAHIPPGLQLDDVIGVITEYLQKIPRRQMDGTAHRCLRSAVNSLTTLFLSGAASPSLVAFTCVSRAANKVIADTRPLPGSKRPCLLVSSMVRCLCAIFSSMRQASESAAEDLMDIIMNTSAAFFHPQVMFQCLHGLRLCAQRFPQTLSPHWLSLFPPLSPRSGMVLSCLIDPPTTGSSAGTTNEMKIACAAADCINAIMCGTRKFIPDGVSRIPQKAKTGKPRGGAGFYTRFHVTLMETHRAIFTCICEAISKESKQEYHGEDASFACALVRALSASFYAVEPSETEAADIFRSLNVLCEKYGFVDRLYAACLDCTATLLQFNANLEGPIKNNIWAVLENKKTSSEMVSLGFRVICAWSHTQKSYEKAFIDRLTNDISCFFTQGSEDDVQKSVLSAVSHMPESLFDALWINGLERMCSGLILATNNSGNKPSSALLTLVSAIPPESFVKCHTPETALHLSKVILDELASPKVDNMPVLLNAFKALLVLPEFKQPQNQALVSQFQKFLLDSMSLSPNSTHSATLLLALSCSLELPCEDNLSRICDALASSMDGFCKYPKLCCSRIRGLGIMVEFHGNSPVLRDITRMHSIVDTVRYGLKQYEDPKLLWNSCKTAELGFANGFFDILPDQQSLLISDVVSVIRNTDNFKAELSALNALLAYFCFPRSSSTDPVLTESIVDTVLYSSEQISTAVFTQSTQHLRPLLISSLQGLFKKVYPLLSPSKQTEVRERNAEYCDKTLNPI